MNLKSITELRAKCWNAIAELRKLQSRAPWSGYTARIVDLIDEIERSTLDLFTVASDNLTGDAWTYFMQVEVAIEEGRRRVGDGSVLLDAAKRWVYGVATPTVDDGDLLYELPRFVEALRDCGAVESVLYDLPSGDLGIFRVDGEWVAVSYLNGHYYVDDTSVADFGAAVTRVKELLA